MNRYKVQPITHPEAEPLVLCPCSSCGKEIVMSRPYFQIVKHLSEDEVIALEEQQAFAGEDEEIDWGEYKVCSEICVNMLILQNMK